MELLHEWLGPTIEQELGEVLEWRGKSEVNRSQLTGQIGDLTFDDDGSNLRIRSAKKQVVQLIKFVPNQEPLQAFLSDSVNRVDATISMDAVQRYTKKTGKRLTDGTLGGFIQLIRFEIVATHIGSRQKRITLFVTELKALGANGSGGYGMPRPIEDLPKIKELIQKLIQFRAQESARRQIPSKQQYPNNTVPLRSDSIASQESSPSDTQTMFATQAPPPRMTAFCSPQPKAFSSGSVVDPRNPLLHRPQAHAKPSLNETKRPVTEGEALLGLLQRSKKQSVNTNVTSGEPTRSHLANGLTTHSETGTFAIPKDSMCPPRYAPRKIIDLSGQPSDSASIPAASEDTLGKDAAEATTPVDTPGWNKSAAMTSFRTRISSRDVNISKDQEKLLNSVDSWLPAEPGRRGPVANLPISILHNLNQKADLRAPRRGTFLKERKHPRSSEELQENHRPSSFDDDNSSPAETDSDAPVADSEWPPSPARDQLPPDSSAENTDVQSNPSAHIRRLSNASVSSRLTQSRRPTPLRIMRSSRNSAERSPLVMSPSIVSNPARQGVHQRSRSGTPKSTASRTLTPVSIGGTSAISHNMEQNAFNGHHEGVDRDESVEAVRAALEDTVPAIMSQRSPRISEIVGGLKPHHDNHLRRSPKVFIKQPSLYIDLSQDQVLSPHRASTSLETSSLQSSRAHSTTENFGGGHRHDIPSGVYSIPPSPESDLEMAAPFSLNDKATFLRDSSHPPFPSTASQPIEPFTQVKRTPYVNGQIRNHSPPRPEREFPLSKSNASHLVANGILLEDVDHVTQSTPPILEVSSSDGFVDNIKENSGSKDIDGYSTTVTAVADEQNHTVQASGKSESHKPEELNGGLVKTDKPDAVEKPAASSGGGQGIFEVNPEGDFENLAGHIDHETKRKASDLDFLSTNVAKRRKKFKISRAFPVTENIESQPDPLDTARRYRQDFISSRKGSEAGKPQESLSTPIAVSKVEPPESRDLRTNPEAQVALEDVTETDRQTLLYDKAQVPGLQDDQTMDIGLVLPKQSRGDESVQVGPLAPSNAEPMARSKSNGSIQGTKISETEAHSKSLPLDDLQEVTPDQTMEEVYTALDNVSAQKNYMRKSSESVSKSNDEDRLEDALTGATPNAITDHTLGDGDAQKATSIDQTLDLGAKVAGPESQHDHLMVTDVDDATPGGQSDYVMVVESEIAKIDGQADQAMDAGAEAAGSSVQSAQTVASDAIRRPENDVSMDVDSGSTTPYPKSDHSADVETHGAILGVQHGEYMDVQPDELNDDTDSADTAKLTKDELGAHVNCESLNFSVNLPSSYESEIQSTIGRQGIPLQDHPKSISDFPNAPKTLIPDADTTQPNGQCVTPGQVAMDPLTSNLQEGQESEAPAIAMSVRPGEYSVSNQHECSAVVLAPVSNGDAKPQFATSRPAEQSALPEVPQPSGNVKTANPTVVSAAEHKEPEIHTAPSSIFDRFRAAYPAYAGDLKHFVAVCRKIKTLVDLDRMQHQYLWDDFIIRHKIEYAQHLRQCAEDAEDALPYEDFYKTEIPKPLYCNEVVTHRKLDEALSLLHIESSASRKRSVNVIETPVKPMRHARAIYEKPLAPEKFSTRVQKRSKRRETIDLTLDDQEDDSIKSSEDESMTPPICSIPKARRSLPWLETNTHLEKTSPQTSKRSPGGLVELGARLRALKEPSVTSTGLDRKAHALNEPSNTPMKPNRNVGRKPDATTDGKSIRETWGVGAHDVLEPRYYDKISPRHLQLMKDIANMVELEEARRLIYKKIHSRTGLHLAASKAVTVADLEAVFDFLLTKKVKKFKSRVKDDSTRTMVDPPGARQPRASRREREDERAGEWWKDDNTPFKSFAKAYKSIKPGNGNSFATGQKVKMEAGVSRAGIRDKKMTGKKIDPLRWEI